MSNYQRMTKNPRTGEFETAEWLDDYFGHHRYGVRFSTGSVIPAENFQWEFQDAPRLIENAEEFENHQQRGGLIDQIAPAEWLAGSKHINRLLEMSRPDFCGISDKDKQHIALVLLRLEVAENELAKIRHALRK